MPVLSRHKHRLHGAVNVNEIKTISLRVDVILNKVIVFANMIYGDEEQRRAQMELPDRPIYYNCCCILLTVEFSFKMKIDQSVLK